MPATAGHTRRLPRGQAIARMLRRLLHQQRVAVNEALSAGRMPDLQAFLPGMVEALAPLLAPIYQQGYDETARRLARQGGQVERRSFGAWWRSPWGQLYRGVQLSQRAAR